MKRILITLFTFILFGANPQQTKMKPLFNGKDLKAWYSFLNTKGKNNDPEKVFTAENGLLHITGKEFGYICTENVFKNFHLSVEFKWGKKKDPPREADTIKRDNGICFYMPLSEKILYGQNQSNARYRKEM